MLSLQLQAIQPNACTIQRFLARPAAWVGLVSCKQVLGYWRYRRGYRPNTSGLLGPPTTMLIYWSRT